MCTIFTTIMNSLDNIINLFYSNTQKTIHFFVYMCVPSLIKLIKTCHYFHDHKAYLYNLIVVRLSTFRGLRIYEITRRIRITEELCTSIIKNIENNKSIQEKSKKYLISNYTRLYKKIKNNDA